MTDAELLEEAKRRYPIGTEFLSALKYEGSPAKCKVTGHSVDIVVGRKVVWGGKQGFLYDDGDWAKIVSVSYKMKPFPTDKVYTKLKVIEGIISKNISANGNLPDIIPYGTITWVNNAMKHWDCSEYYHIENNRWRANIPKKYFEALEEINPLKTEKMEPIDEIDKALAAYEELEAKETKSKSKPIYDTDIDIGDLFVMKYDPYKFRIFKCYGFYEGVSILGIDVTYSRNGHSNGYDFRITNKFGKEIKPNFASTGKGNHYFVRAENAKRVTKTEAERIFKENSPFKPGDTIKLKSSLSKVNNMLFTDGMVRTLPDKITKVTTFTFGTDYFGYHVNGWCVTMDCIASKVSAEIKPEVITPTTERGPITDSSSKYVYFRPKSQRPTYFNSDGEMDYMLKGAYLKVLSNDGDRWTVEDIYNVHKRWVVYKSDCDECAPMPATPTTIDVETDSTYDYSSGSTETDAITLPSIVKRPVVTQRLVVDTNFLDVVIPSVKRKK